MRHKRKPRGGIKKGAEVWYGGSKYIVRSTRRNGWTELFSQAYVGRAFVPYGPWLCVRTWKVRLTP